MKHNDCCEGPLHSVHCWWCVYNDDGRPQSTGDAEVDKLLSRPASPWHESFIPGYRTPLRPVPGTPGLQPQETFR